MTQKDTKLKNNDPHATKMRKNNFLEAFKKSLGIVSHACEKVGIERKTYYRWLESDKEFANRVEETAELKKDFVESKLYKLVKDENPAVVIFAAKNLLKDRGINNNLDVTLKGNITHYLSEEEQQQYDNAEVEKLEKIKEIISE